jgi:hypothetical protein
MRARMLFATTLALSWCSLFSPSAGMADVGGHVRLALATPSSFANVATTAKRSSYVVLQAWDGERAAQLKAANPGLVVLMYQNASAMTKGAGPKGVYSSGVGYEQADTAHPDWFLKDTAGKRIVEGSYDWVYMADLGNAAYQDAWATTVIERLQSGPWDGVFMDDVNTTAMYHTDPSKIAQYPNDAAYQAATRSMRRRSAPARRGQARDPEHRLVERVPRRRQGLAAVRRRRHGRDVCQVVDHPGRGLPPRDRLEDPSRGDPRGREHGQALLGRHAGRQRRRAG